MSPEKPALKTDGESVRGTDPGFDQALRILAHLLVRAYLKGLDAGDLDRQIGLDVARQPEAPLAPMTGDDEP